MAAKRKTDSGLIWSAQTQNVNLLDGYHERLKFANIKQLTTGVGLVRRRTSLA